MDYMLKKYLAKVDFDSYEDFIANYKLSYPEDFNFGFDIVDGWAEVEPEKRALVWCNDSGESHTFTFTDVKKQSNKIANAIKRLGLKKGDSVLLIMRRRYEYWFTVTALHKMGVIAIPATFQLTKKDIVYRVNKIGIDMCICADDPYVIEQIDLSREECPSLRFYAKLGEKRDGWLDFKALYESESDVFERPTGEDAVMADDPMLMYFTSGTTGMPKLVQHVQSYPLGHILTAKYWQQVIENGLHLTVADSGWAKFSWGKIYGQWIAGTAVMGYDMDKFRAPNLMKVIHDFGVTTFCAPATMYRFMIKEDMSEFDLSSVKHFSMAGEPLNPSVMEAWQKITGHRIYEGFGQTESVVIMANYGWSDPRPGSTGKPAASFNIKIMREDGTECDIGEEGEIVVVGAKEHRPTGLTIGYYEDEEANERLWRGGNYHTGDNAWYDSDGYIWFVGRNDDVIKCSGYRIGPFEVESAIMTHPSVVECAVTAAPDPVRGQVVKATIVLAKGYEPSDALKKEIQDHVKKVTAPYKYPRIVEFVDELPKTVSGKIKRNVIRKNDEEATR